MAVCLSVISIDSERTERMKVPKRDCLPKRIVSAGTYVVTRTRREVLVAYLGSCVGLTLCDRKTGVGGLIHLLLPAPIGTEASCAPVSYAVTGLPLFIRALEDAGAAKKNLEACVAGGAMLAPVSQQDLNLDIGGRTADAVNEILGEERIPVCDSETGGVFGYSLSLNLTTWENKIEPACRIPGVVEEKELKKPDSGDLEKAIQRIRPIPQVALKIIRMMRQNNHSISDVSNEIRQDQVISASVLRLCNSSFVGSGNKVDSVDRALIVLGEKRLLQLVVSASMEDFFVETGQGYSLCKGGLYRHALGTAIIAEHLGDLTGRVASDLAYTAGLLHDIGKVVLDQYMAPARCLFYRRVQDEGHNLIHAEQKTLGVTHCDIGVRLAEAWRLPRPLIHTIAYHHYPEQAPAHSALAHLVYVADFLMSRLVVGQEFEHLDTNGLHRRLKRIGLASSDFPAIIEQIPKGVFTPGGSI